MTWSVYCPRPSASVRILARAAGTRRIRYKAALPGVLAEPVVNWGSARTLELTAPGTQVANRPQYVAHAVSKQLSYSLWTGAPWALSVVRPQDAQRTRHDYLVRRDGLSGGRGIEIWDGRELQAGEFLVAKYPKTHEFRVHVAFGQIIDFTQKKWRGEGNRTGLVRSHENGWIHAHNDIVLSPADATAIGDASVQAVALLGVDFGAADVMAVLDHDTPRRLRSFRICEINTAPGLGNRVTAEAYVNAFNNWATDGG